MTWAAVIVIWGTTQWGIADGQTKAQCEAKVDQAVKEYKATSEPCVELKTETVLHMKKMSVGWSDAKPGNPVIGGFDCAGRRCRSFDK